MNSPGVSVKKTSKYSQWVSQILAFLVETKTMTGWNAEIQLKCKTIVRDILSGTVLLIKLIVLCCSPSVKCIICLGSLMTTASMLWLGIGLTVG